MSNRERSMVLSGNGDIIEGMELTSRVPELMEKHGVPNAHRLAALTGLGYTTCYRLAHGDLPSRASTIVALADAFGIVPGSLFKATK